MIVALAALAAAQAITSPPLAGTVEDPPATERREDGRPITGIAFIGTDAPGPVAEAAKAFVGRPNTRRTLAELVGALTRAYESSPVALYTVAIPEQDFAGGVVKVSLTEAAVEKVEVGDAERFPRLAGLASRLTAEKPLSRATYERQLSLMRAIPGVKYSLTTDNPDLDDDVTMSFQPARRKVEAAFGVSNRGPDPLGDIVGDGRIDFNALMVDGDRLRFSGAMTPDPRRYRQLGVGYDVPIGLSGLALSSNFALVRTRAKGVDLEGKARVAQLALTYPVIRSFHKALDVGVMVDGVNSSNALFGNVISSDRVRTLRALAGYSSAFAKDKLQANLILSRGLDIFGARVNPLLSDQQFVKASAGVNYERELSARLVARASALGQYSRDRLPASELFTIGGATVGRAFDTALLSGDRGYGIAGELAVRPLRAGAFAKSELYAYADRGAVAIEARAAFPTQHYDLASAGIGARAKWKDKAELGVELGRVVDKPYPAYDQKWRVSLLYRLTI